MGSPPLPTALITGIIDGDNAGDASDIHVSYLPPNNPEGITSLRAFLIPASQAAQFGNSAAAAAPSTSYVTVPLPSGASQISFPSSGTDVTGQPVSDGSSYAVRVQSIGASTATPSMSAVSPTVTLAVTNLVRTLTGTIQSGPGGLSIDQEGNLFLGDYGERWAGPGGNGITKITPTGVVSSFASGFDGTSGNAFAANGDLFQMSLFGNRLKRVSPSGTATQVAEGITGGAYGIAVAPGDTVFAVTCDNQIYKISPDGTVSVWLSSDLLACGRGMARGDDGTLYVTSFVNGNILQVTPDGHLSWLANLPGGSAGEIAFGGGVLYATDRGGLQIYRILLTGETTLVAGTGERSHRDGSALEAQLTSPFSLTVTPDGKTVYFSDLAMGAQPGQIKPVVIRKLEIVEP